MVIGLATMQKKNSPWKEETHPRSDQVPPLGFTSCPPCLVFLQNDEILPIASTCALEQRLPMAHDDSDKFKDAMILGFTGHVGFGGV